MVIALSEMAAERLAKDPHALSTEEMRSLQRELLVAVNRCPSSAMTFAPATGHEPIPSLDELDAMLVAVARRVPVLIGVDKP